MGIDLIPKPIVVAILETSSVWPTCLITSRNLLEDQRMLHGIFAQVMRHPARRKAVVKRWFDLKLLRRRQGLSLLSLAERIHKTDALFLREY